MSSVFVSGFDNRTPASAVESHFSTIGPVKAVRFVGKGSAVVTYESFEDADRAVIDLNNSTMEGNHWRVSVKIDRKGQGKGKDGKDSKGSSGHTKAAYGKGMGGGTMDNHWYVNAKIDRQGNDGKDGKGSCGHDKGYLKGYGCSTEVLQPHAGERDYSDGEMETGFVATRGKDRRAGKGNGWYDKRYGAGGYGKGKGMAGGAPSFPNAIDARELEATLLSSAEPGTARPQAHQTPRAGDRDRQMPLRDLQQPRGRKEQGKDRSCGYDKGYGAGGYGKGKGMGGGERDYSDGEMETGFVATRGLKDLRKYPLSPDRRAGKGNGWYDKRYGAGGYGKGKGMAGGAPAQAP
ncbi:cspJ [Symbiodinium sp. CCMP2592]|nr:cspJ [Symbiodinium sp. CCMP2592]